VQFSGTIWQVTVNNSLCHRLQACICIWSIMLKHESTKPQVHNVLHCYQTRTKPQSQVTCTENVAKSECKICKWQTDPHADMLISILCTLAEGEAKVSNHLMLYVTLLPAHSTGIKMYSTCQEVNHNKCVSRLAGCILHRPKFSIPTDCRNYR